MKRFFLILCTIILISSYSSVQTSGSSERITSTNAVRVFGVVTDMNGVSVPNVTLKFISNDGMFDTLSDDEGLYSIQLPVEPTGVESSTPETFTLSQNYPNPFNPSTVIEYSLNETSDITLDIFSITGQHVRSLVRGTESLGMHSVVWDSRNDAGTGVAAGIYLYRLRTDGRTQTKKMVLVDGAVSNFSFSGNNPESVSKHGIDSAVKKEYTVVATKSSMRHFMVTMLISDYPSEIENNIILPDTYIPYSLIITSDHYNNFYIFPGDSFGVTLIGIHEEDYSQECQVTLHSGAGDIETITLSQTDYLGNFSLCGEWTYYPDIRRGSINSSDETPIQNNGIIEVNALADTVIATYTLTQGVFATASIAVIDSLETVVVNGITYAHWGDEWYHVSEDNYWELILHNTFSIHFKESTTEDEILEFIENNNLEVKSILITGTYIIKFTVPTNAIQFLQEHVENPIIEYINPNRSICVY